MTTPTTEGRPSAARSAIERCERTTITIATRQGSKEIRAWKLGDFACHQGVGPHAAVWVITYIPQGLSMNTQGVFANEDDAAAAMEQIATEGDWSDLGSLPNRQALAVMVRRVFEAHSAARIVP